MRSVPFATLALAALVVVGCPKPPEKGECKSSPDCEKQQGYGKVCVEGRCQECAADTDCKDGFVCRTNKCVPKPQCTSDRDCPSGQMCQDERCVPKSTPQIGSVCSSDAECGSDMTCVNGRCSKAAVAPECADASAFVIHFGFDQSLLETPAKDTLQRLADCLKGSPAKRVVIAGNCDERGTTQYNIALGSRRAEVAKKYLADLGLSSPLETVSYGKEQAICKQSTEACWAKNRRDDFQIER